jgi:NOL1/NOP2/fmu family ribosome biogenesis protein
LERVGGGREYTGYCKDWLTNPDDFYLDVFHNRIRAFPVLYQDTFLLLSAHLRIVLAGVLLGEIKGKEVQPSTALALNTYFCHEAFPAVELTWEESIRYLRKETLVLPATVPNGYVVVKYRNIPLGFVKNIGSRANNLFPGEWRVKKIVRS